MKNVNACLPDRGYLAMIGDPASRLLPKAVKMAEGMNGM